MTTGWRLSDESASGPPYLCERDGVRSLRVPESWGAATLLPRPPRLTHPALRTLPGTAGSSSGRASSLEDLIAVRAIVSFYLNPPGGLSRRYNLIEGHLCFALFVNPDGSLQGTIVDAEGELGGGAEPTERVSIQRLAPGGDPS